MEGTMKQYNETNTIKLRTSLGVTWCLSQIEDKSIHDKNF